MTALALASVYFVRRVPRAENEPWTCGVSVWTCCVSSMHTPFHMGLCSRQKERTFLYQACAFCCCCCFRPRCCCFTPRRTCTPNPRRSACLYRRLYARAECSYERVTHTDGVTHHSARITPAPYVSSDSMPRRNCVPSASSHDDVRTRGAPSYDSTAPPLPHAYHPQPSHSSTLLAKCCRSCV